MLYLWFLFETCLLVVLCVCGFCILGTGTGLCGYTAPMVPMYVAVVLIRDEIQHVH